MSTESELFREVLAEIAAQETRMAAMRVKLDEISQYMRKRHPAPELPDQPPSRTGAQT